MDRFWAYKDVLVDSGSPLAMTKSFLNSDYPLHRHDFYELVIITGGSGEHRLNGMSHRLFPGMVFVIKPKDLHGYFGNRNLSLVNVIMYGADMLNLLQDLKTMAGFQSLFIMDQGRQAKDSINFHQLTPSELILAGNMLETMEREYEKRLPGYQAKLKSIFLDLAVLITRSCEEPARHSDDSAARLGRALAYMEKNYYREITVPEIAEKANLSLRQFQRLFDMIYHISPVRYLMNLRIRAACSHLINTDAPVSEIAELCGFGDSNYFSRQFKKATGQSPSDYRAEN